MHVGYAFLAVYSLSLIQRTGANIFYLKDQWRGNDFFQGWNWETADDPTHGRVNYVSLADAQSKNLTIGTSLFSSRRLPQRNTRLGTEHLSLCFSSAVGNTFIMRADDWSIVTPTARGRDSVRISSQTAYDEAVFVLDLQHMPYGCATWPAFWTLSKQGPWPTGGEIDVIEGKHSRALFIRVPPSESLTRACMLPPRTGVNQNLQNQATLHTLPGCTMPPNRVQTG